MNTDNIKNDDSLQNTAEFTHLWWTTVSLCQLMWCH